MKTYPQIGSKYSGPHLDRSPLRQMPQGWVLEPTEVVSKPSLRTLLKTALWIIVAIGYLAVLGTVISP